MTDFRALFNSYVINGTENLLDVFILFEVYTD